MNERVDPVPETMAGPVFAYRGQELHGVPMEGRPDLIEKHDEGVPVVPNPEPDEQPPIPVRIVQSGGRELTRFRVTRAFAGDATSRIVGQDDNRVSVKIRNVSAADTAWIADQMHLASEGFGYPLVPGAELSLTADGDLFATTGTPGTVVPLAVLIEHTVKVN